LALEDKNFQDKDNDFIDKLVFINRVASVVKGGRRFSLQH
jgi:Ribosomal protein S5